MKKGIFALINEHASGTSQENTNVVMDDSRSVFQFINEGIATVNGLISESSFEITNLNESLVGAALTRSGEVDVISEGIMKSAGDSIKKFFETIKGIIKGVIDKITMNINANRKNGAQLVAQYGDRVKGASTEGIEIKGYKHQTSKVTGWVTSGDEGNINDIKQAVDNLDSTLTKFMSAENIESDADISTLNKALSNATSEFTKEEVDKLREDNSDFQEKMKAIVLAATGESVNGKSLTEIQQELLKAARDNQTEKIVIKAKDYNMDTVAKELSNGVELTSIARTLEGFKKKVEEMQRVFEKTIKEIETSKDSSADSTAAAKASYFKSNKVTYMNAAKDYLSKVYNVNNAINAVVIKIVEEDYMQKKDLFMAVARKTKVKKQNNGVDLIDEVDLDFNGDEL